MRKLDREFVEQCPRERGFRLRGMQTTRIETLVDAAFAFAITMLVISFDNIPADFDEMILALKGTPAFVAAVAQLVWIWYTHNLWSRRFGLEDAWTVTLSALLLIVVMVYVYPLRIVFEGAFAWLSGGRLPTSFDMGDAENLGVMFLIFGAGFIALSSIFFAMNRYAASNWQALRLDVLERYQLTTQQGVWLFAALIGVFSMALALLLPARLVPYAGFGYMLLGIIPPLYEYRRGRRAPQP